MSINVVLGKGGAGKDMYAMEAGVVPCWKYGRAVVSNITLYPEMLGFPPEFFIPLDDPIEELPRLGRHMRTMCRDCRHRNHPEATRCRAPHPTRDTCDGQIVTVPRMTYEGDTYSITGNRGVGLLISDVNSFLPSRETLGLPPIVGATMQQLRHLDVAPVFVTCPAFARVDLQLRECTTSIIESYPFAPFGMFSKPSDTPWGWPKHRAFVRYQYDPEQYEKADAMGKKCPPVPFHWYKAGSHTIERRRVRAYQLAYDSYEDVKVADHIACPECQGKLPRMACKDPANHRDMARRQRPAREVQQYPIPELLIENAAGEQPVTDMAEARELIAASVTAELEEAHH